LYIWLRKFVRILLNVPAADAAVIATAAVAIAAAVADDIRVAIAPEKALGWTAFIHHKHVALISGGQTAQSSYAERHKWPDVTGGGNGSLTAEVKELTTLGYSGAVFSFAPVGLSTHPGITEK
jgi:hypothetical protein